MTLQIIRSAGYKVVSTLGSAAVNSARSVKGSVSRVYSAWNADETTTADKWAAVTTKDKIITSVLTGLLSAGFGALLIYLGSEGLEASSEYGFMGKFLTSAASDISIGMGCVYIVAGGGLFYYEANKRQNESKHYAHTSHETYEQYRAGIGRVSQSLTENEAHVTSIPETLPYRN